MFFKYRVYTTDWVGLNTIFFFFLKKDSHDTKRVRSSASINSCDNDRTVLTGTPVFWNLGFCGCLVFVMGWDPCPLKMDP